MHPNSEIPPRSVAARSPQSLRRLPSPSPFLLSSSASSSSSSSFSPRYQGTSGSILLPLSLPFPLILDISFLLPPSHLLHFSHCRSSALCCTSPDLEDRRLSSPGSSSCPSCRLRCERAEGSVVEEARRRRPSNESELVSSIDRGDGFLLRRSLFLSGSLLFSAALSPLWRLCLLDVLGTRCPPLTGLSFLLKSFSPRSYHTGSIQLLL